MGPCSKGPIIKIVPDNIIYENLSINDVAKVVQDHLIGGKVVEELLFSDDHDQKKVLKEEDSAFLGPQRKIVLRNCGTVNPLE